MRDGLVCLTLKITIRRGPPIEANVLLGGNQARRALLCLRAGLGKLVGGLGVQGGTHSIKVWKL